MQLQFKWKPAARLNRGRLAEYVSPVQPVPRTVVLEPGFAETKKVKVFGQGWDEGAARQRAAALAGSVSELSRLARRWEARWERPTHALVILSRVETGLALEEERDLLWDAFGVPIFEQVIDASNQLLASECEAHDGLHIRQSGLRIDGCFEYHRACGCGDASPRLAAAPEKAMALAAPQ